MPIEKSPILNTFVSGNSDRPKKVIEVRQKGRKGRGGGKHKQTHQRKKKMMKSRERRGRKKREKVNRQESDFEKVNEKDVSVAVDVMSAFLVPSFLLLCYQVQNLDHPL